MMIIIGLIRVQAVGTSSPSARRMLWVVIVARAGCGHVVVAPEPVLYGRPQGATHRNAHHSPTSAQTRCADAAKARHRHYYFLLRALVHPLRRGRRRSYSAR